MWGIFNQIGPRVSKFLLKSELSLICVNVYKKLCDWLWRSLSIQSASSTYHCSGRNMARAPQAIHCEQSPIISVYIDRHSHVTGNMAKESKRAVIAKILNDHNGDCFASEDVAGVVSDYFTCESSVAGSDCELEWDSDDFENVEEDEYRQPPPDPCDCIGLSV